MTDTTSWEAALDADAARLWADFSGGLQQRGLIDERTRLLVAVGQCVSAGEVEEMAALVREALLKDVAPREVLEVILQAAIYVGKPKINRAGRAFLEIATELGIVEQLRNSPLPARPSLDEQRREWRVSDQRFPRRQELMDRYGWQGIGAGLKTQPWHHVQSIEWIDSVDRHFTQLWLDYIYAGIYSRGVLDDKTRSLTMVGDCVMMEELEQAENHMRNAVTLGATRAELLEILLHSTQFTGMPRSFKAIRILLRITAESPLSS